MILVPYFLVGAFLLKIATRPLHKAVGVGACIYGLWFTVRLWSNAPCCYPLFCMRRAAGFLYARKTHTHDNVLNRQEMVLIGMLLIASSSGDLDAGGITFIPSLDSKGDNDG